MTYREYRKHCDREYLSLMLDKHKTITAVARAAGIDRTFVYKLAASCGLTLPRRPAGNRGNEAWQRLTAESRTYL